MGATVRLQKFMAGAGLASRREAEVWIRAGRVAVNGKKVTVLGTKVDPAHDRIVVDGRRVMAIAQKVLYLFYKPKNVMVTRKDPEGRPTIYDYLEKIPERLFPVGRLDFESEGLLVLTNDGEFANRLAHPRYRVEKVYEVKVASLPSEDQLRRLKQGIELDSEKSTPTSVKMIAHSTKSCWLRVVLREGKNREIRRMMDTVGLEIIRLIRTRIGPFALSAMKPGELSNPLSPRRGPFGA